MHVYDILRRPVVTEKSNAQGDAHNQYSFQVDRRANKIQIKDAVETAFNVKVMSVRVVNIPARMGHYGRRPVIKKSAWKKAIVTVAPGQTIQFFEGV
jgi:large subunit ribosomal protein L23